KTNVGSNRATLQAAEDADASYLSQFGKVSFDPAQFIGFELQKAGDFGQIAARYYLGALGRGFVAPFEIHATTDSAGNVTIQDGPDVRAFAKNSDGTYRSMPGDTGTLTLVGGAFHIKELDGVETVFRASDGKFNF